MGHRLNPSKDKGSIEKKELILMNFCSSWSSPCTTQWSILEDLSTILQDCIRIVKVNIDDPGHDPDKYNINAIPTLCLYREGKEIKRFIGVQQLDTLLEVIKIYMEKEKCNA